MQIIKARGCVRLALRFYMSFEAFDAFCFSMSNRKISLCARCFEQGPWDRFDIKRTTTCSLEKCSFSRKMFLILHLGDDRYAGNGPLNVVREIRTASRKTIFLCDGCSGLCNWRKKLKKLLVNSALNSGCGKSIEVKAGACATRLGFHAHQKVRGPQITKNTINSKSCLA